VLVLGYLRSFCLEALLSKQWGCATLQVPSSKFDIQESRDGKEGRKALAMEL